MKIAFVSVGDLGDPRYWSGIPYWMFRSIRQHNVDTEAIAPLNSSLKCAFAPLIAYYRLHGQRLLWLRERAVLRSFARQIQSRLDEMRPDIVVSESSIPLSLLDCRQPIVFWSDAVADAMLDYYPGPHFSSVPPRSRRMAHQQEHRALARASLAVYSSVWAADSAREFHSVDPAKLRVLPYGANLPINHGAKEVRNHVCVRPPDACRLVFIGVEWQRKGGPLCVEIAKQLNSRHPTELIIIGAPELVGTQFPPYVKYLGLIDKSTDEGRKEIMSVLAKSHFLLLPTQADATPIVISEASAFGVPVLATRTGGLASVVADAVNGFLLAPSTPADRWAALIMELIQDRERYQGLALSSFAYFEERLSWQSNTTKLLAWLQELL